MARRDGASPTRTAADVWTSQTIRNADDLSALASEWEDLYGRCAGATPFQSYAWVSAWWRAYGDTARLRAIIVRHEGRLVFAAPLVGTRRWGVPVLTLVGGDLSDMTDFLLSDDYRTDSPLIARALLERTGGVPIELFETPPYAAAWLIADAWRGRVWRGSGMTCLELPGKPIDELLATLPKPAAKRLRKKLRKIDEQHIVVRDVESPDTRSGIEALLRLHERQWQGRGINPDHLSPRFAVFLAGAVPAMIERGHARLLEYERDGETLAAELLVVGRQFVGAYLNGIDPRLRDLDVTALSLREDLAITARLGKPMYSMLRGVEPYKLQLVPRAAVNRRLLLAGNQRSASAYAALVLARDRAVEMTRQHAPWALDLARRGRRTWSQMRTPGV